MSVIHLTGEIQLFTGLFVEGPGGEQRPYPRGGAEDAGGIRTRAQRQEQQQRKLNFWELYLNISYHVQKSGWQSGFF